jgi:hypothetical protein
MAKNENEGLIHHCVGVRYRVRGVGNLRTTLFNFDEVDSSELFPIPMTETAPKLPFVLANFNSQGMQVEFKISEIEETFIINRIVVYIKPSATGHPL